VTCASVAHLHSTPEEAGEEFSKIRPKLAVYGHFSLFGTPESTIGELITRTRRTYQGPLEIGEDLLAINRRIRRDPADSLTVFDCA
jgi:ribonuclease Z